MAARILIVDDEQDLVDSLRYNLEREGYEVLEAGDGLRALELLGQFPVPDLVLLDLMLPLLSGAEVCSRMRMQERTRGLPVIVFSACIDEIHRVAALDLGVQGYVSKPFRVRELLARVRASLGGEKGHEAACGSPVDEAYRRIML